MPLVQPGPVELALETADRSDQVASQAFSTKPHYRVEDEKTGLSELEAHILTSIDHVGWYAHLWFPAVARGMLNFGSKEREENVHSAIIGLIRKGALVLTNPEAFRINEDDWRQVEFIVDRDLPQVEREMAAIEDFKHANRVGLGWKNVYVRKERPDGLFPSHLPYSLIESIPHGPVQELVIE